jgi:hypothetical protein
VNELVKIQDEKQIGALATDYAGRVDALKVTSRESYGLMVQLVKEAKQFQEAVTAFFEPMRKATYDAYQEVLTQKKKHVEPFEKAEKIGKMRMRGWEQIEEERARKAREKQAEAAREAMKNGTPPPVLRVVENKAHVDGVTFVDNWKAVRIEGCSMQALCKWVLEGKIPEMFLMVNESEANKFARATGGKVTVPGFRFENERIARVSA